MTRLLQCKKKKGRRIFDICGVLLDKSWDYRRRNDAIIKKIRDRNIEDKNAILFLNEQKFEYTEEEYEILKNIYIMIFNSDYSKEVKNIMFRNMTFLTSLYEDNFYSQIEDKATRLYFAVFLQTQECLRDLVQRFDLAYIVRYLSNILGFEDERAASYFVNLAERYEEIASSQQVYNNTYDKLVSPSLKGRLTKAKNKYSS